MFPSFIPQKAENLSELTSIELIQQIERQAIVTPLSPQPITTTYVRQGKGGIPILLLHGFDSSVLEFRRLLPLLAQENETWTVDLLGFGFTERLNFNYLGKVRSHFGNESCRTVRTNPL
jgi:pimeloyl-ACP methyl ester carboxylesterase